MTEWVETKKARTGESLSLKIFRKYPRLGNFLLATIFSFFDWQALGQDVLMGTKEEEWGNHGLTVRDKSSQGVVLRDRLMTDAALGGPRPIKSEHNYSLLTSSPPPSPATPGANPHTPNSGSSADRVGASLSANSSNSIDSTNMDHHKSLDIRSRIDGKIILSLYGYDMELNGNVYKYNNNVFQNF